MNELKNFIFEKHLLILLAITFFAFLVRVLLLTNNPPGFFADEASIGYNAYTILKYGTDEHGKAFPVFFRAFGEYKSPIQIYATVPSIAIFGLTEFATRLPSVIFATLTVFALFFLVRELTKSLPHPTIIALLSSFFLAIVPWHIHLGRIAFEQNPYLLFSTLGLLFLLKARYQIHYLPLSGVCFALSIYSYFPARIFIPLFSIGLFMLFFKSFYRHKKQLFLTAVLSFLLLLPMIHTMISGDGFSRWNQVNVFSDATNSSEAIIHISQNYLSHFSTDFLFFKGDSQMPGQFITRHSVKGFGELYLFQLPFILFGLFYLMYKKHYRILGVTVLWLLLYPTGSMFTTDVSAQATRSVIGVLPFQILTGIGAVGLLTFFPRERIKVTFLLGTTVLFVGILSVISYLTVFFTQYPTYASGFYGWQYGAKYIVRSFETYEKNYDMFVMAPEFNAPYIFFRFYAPDNCGKCTIGLPESHYIKGQNQLFAITPEYLRTHQYAFDTKAVIFYPNNTVAFLVGEIVE